MITETFSQEIPITWLLEHSNGLDLEKKICVFTEDVWNYSHLVSWFVCQEGGLRHGPPFSQQWPSPSHAPALHQYNLKVLLSWQRTLPLGYLSSMPEFLLHLQFDLSALAIFAVMHKGNVTEQEHNSALLSESPWLWIPGGIIEVPLSFKIHPVSLL